MKYIFIEDDAGTELNFCSVECAAFGHEPPPQIHIEIGDITMKFPLNCTIKQGALSYFQCHSSSVLGIEFPVSNNTIEFRSIWYVNALSRTKCDSNVKPFIPTNELYFVHLTRSLYGNKIRKLCNNFHITRN